MPDLGDRFSRGEFKTMVDWLRENIHKHGARYRANVLCKRVTGEALSHKPLVDYMNDKYSGIYGF